eukprot:6457584-Amphidinium_carterae.2
MLTRIAAACAVETQLWRFQAWRQFSVWQVSSCGRVCNTRGQVSWGTRLATGYNACRIGGKFYLVHRLVAQEFLPPAPAAEHHVLHIDGDASNNHVSNLAYASVEESSRDAAARRTHPGRTGRSVVVRMAGSSAWIPYSSIAEAAQVLPVSRDTLSRICLGKSNSKLFEAKFNEAPDLPNERWVPLVNPGTGMVVPQSMVSSHGRVQLSNCDRSRGGATTAGYLRICVQGKLQYVHRIVLCSFMGMPANEQGSMQWEVNHLDGDKGNNSLDNLEWVTRSENLRHAYSLVPWRFTGAQRPVERRCLGEQEWTRFDSITAAALLCDCSRAAISKCLRDERVSTSGHEWRYAPHERLHGEEWRDVHPLHSG